MVLPSTRVCLVAIKNFSKRRDIKIELRGLCKREVPCFNANMAVCQARVLDCEQVFPRTGEKFHTSKECGKKPKVKIGVDDGEGSMYICASCFRRFSKRVAVPGDWYGWFDCEYPAEARVKFSPWWRAAVAAEEAAPAYAEEESEEEAEEHLADPRVALLTQQIATMEISLQKNTPQMKMKEVVAAHKQLIQARAQLKIIQRA